MQEFPAKLLLFGEHVLLLGASALSVPVRRFSGYWNWAADFNNGSKKRQRMFQFAESAALKAIPGLDTTAFIRDLQDGLVFESNIPSGYGLGSSGAYCAAVYDAYCQDKTTDMRILKATFAEMESFFHGSSSGIDPLTSYLRKPLLIKKRTEVEAVRTTPWLQQPIVFLLDTEIPRQTGPMVQWFLNQARIPAFRTAFERDYLPVHEAVVQAWIEADPVAFWMNLRTLSELQMVYLIPMIPESLRSLWFKSFENNDFTLKICGAGGGGFILGFAKEKETVENLAGQYPILYPMAR